MSASDGDEDLRVWLRAFVLRFRRYAGREPNPIDLAHNLPLSMSDGSAMKAMVEFMERKPDNG